MGLTHGGIPQVLASRLREQTGIRTLIETGTSTGATAKWAAALFDTVITIEASEEICKAARQALHDLPNVQCLQGDSREMLRTAIRSAPRPVLFWLDAHYCGGPTYHAECPLLNEIEIINQEAPDAFILIDDARFVLSPWVGEQFCTIDALCKALENDTHGRYMVVVEDVIVAVPHAARDVIQAHCYEVTLREWQEHDRQLYRRYNIFQRAVLKLFNRVCG